MRILFTSLSCLVDPSSGAAISVRTILGQLATRGHEVMSLSGACFDKAQMPSPVDMLKWCKFTKDPQTPFWRYDDAAVTHLALPLNVHSVSKANAQTVDQLTETARTLIADFQPDVVISYGGTPYELGIRRLARAQAIGSVMYLANPSYKDKVTFADADLVFTDTVATQALYQDRLNLDSVVIGKFIAQSVAKRPGKSARHVTFVNPSYPKGVTLFYRIAEMMNATLPSVKFLVVESRGNLDDIEEGAGIPFSQMRNIRRIGLQADMTDVFSRTHVLLIPSLWHESGSRTAVEALSLGIPIVGSNHGGSPELLGDGATLFDVPDPLREHPRLIPPPSVAVPWVSALAQLWTDDDHWVERSAAATAQWQRHDPSERIVMVEAHLQELANARD
ncbi:MAG: glycosyltransferase [Pseudomonadota bacterium]